MDILHIIFGCFHHGWFCMSDCFLLSLFLVRGVWVSFGYFTFVSIVISIEIGWGREDSPEMQSANHCCTTSWSDQLCYLQLLRWSAWRKGTTIWSGRILPKMTQHIPRRCSKFRWGLMMECPPSQFLASNATKTNKVSPYAKYTLLWGYFGRIWPDGSEPFAIIPAAGRNDMAMGTTTTSPLWVKNG